MVSQTQIELIAEQILARRGDTASWFAETRAQDAAACGDAQSTDIWRQISAVLGAPTSTDPLTIHMTP